MSGPVTDRPAEAMARHFEAAVARCRTVAQVDEMLSGRALLAGLGLAPEAGAAERAAAARRKAEIMAGRG